MANKVVVQKNGVRIIHVAEKGAKGDRGEQGVPAFEQLSEIPDVEIDSDTLNHMDTLTWDSNINKWVNKDQEDLVDGGNF